VRIPRIFQPVSLASGRMIELDAQATAHISRVLRLKPEDALVVFNGEGGEYEATVCRVERRVATIEIGAFVERSVESPLELVLVQGVSRGERMDYTVQKAVELGVTRIVPVLTERTVVNLKGDRKDKRREHWQSVVNSACEQSGRNNIPEVAPVITLHEWLGEPNEGLKLVLHHRAEGSLPDRTAQQDAITLLIGPEGGLSSNEISVAQTAGYFPLCLGPRVMRTETAAVAAISVLQWVWGDFGCIQSV
jgi:16S rRNA (uracil1498-N3)-methyltransferase